MSSRQPLAHEDVVEIPVDGTLDVDALSQRLIDVHHRDWDEPSGNGGGPAEL